MIARHLIRIAFLLVIAAFSTGCVVGKVAATPLVFVRDVVDVPLVSVTNVFETWADRSDPWAAPTPGVSWHWNGGFNAGIGYSLGFFVFKGMSWIFGGVDYVVCRSLYPNFPAGVSPWKKEGKGWGSLYFPGTKAVWGDDPPDSIWDDDGEPPGKDPAPAAAPK